MDNIFCTLFDSNYLDKGLVLYDSMCKNIMDFKLYIFTFDEKSYEIIKSEAKQNLIPVSISDLESAYPCLIEAKNNRSTVEYNWTCSAWTIKYVLEQKDESICTYIDADMRFYSDPAPVFKQMRAKKCSIIIVPHRFHSDEFARSEGLKTGFYCVEFNTFVNDENGKKALNWWAEQCCKWCYYVVPSIDKWFGEQKYLNEFPNKFEGVFICDHYGVGLGPWNDNRMELDSVGDNIILIDKQSGIKYTLILYHFAGVRFLGEHFLKVASRMTSKKLHRAVFDEYVKEIMEKRRYVKETYNYIITKERIVPAQNPILRLYQKYIMPYLRLGHFFNIYRVDD